LRLSLVNLLGLTSALASGPATFQKDVLPILQKRCQECHRPGQIAPMSLLTYAETRPWAKSIRQAVLTRTMPPWFADPKYGHFADDRSLSQSEIETLVNWVESGAAEGPARDAPPLRVWPRGWAIGTPDAVFEMRQPFSIPAKGTIAYQYIIIPTRLSEDKWIQKVEIRPSDHRVVHHAVVYVREPGSKWLDGQPGNVAFSVPLTEGFTTSDVLMVYTPGNSFDLWKTGMAKKIKAGSDIVLQMHYTADGAATNDRTRIGVVFAKEPPKQAVLTLQMGNDKFVIPAGDASYRVAVSGTLPNDAVLISLFPHMHLRGKSFEYSIARPNGNIETLLKINDYDFNWQLNYRLSEPRLVPAGTRLLWTAYFDNSSKNPRNPNPDAEVRFGEQSWEEMMIGFFDVAVDAAIDKTAFFRQR
jgi:hypothetical protein